MPVKKQGWTDLAVFGAPPAFSERLHVGRPNIGNKDRLMARIEDLLSRRWLSNGGPFVLELERRLADFLGVRHCIATCNGTAAIEIAVRALGLTGEVIVPSFTFIATAHALQWLGVTPVFCDVNRRTHNIDPSQVERLITSRTTGLLGVHLWGRPCETDALAGICERRRLQLLFDASHAFGCSHQGRMIGNFGRLEVFSFHATKFFNTFEGGAVATNDDALATRIRRMKDFGFAEGHDDVVCLGINAKMSEVSAAMGLTGLESLEEFVAAGRRNYKQYQAELAGLPGVRLVTFDEAEKCNYQYIVLEIDAAGTPVGRDLFLQILQAENVMARRYFYPGCHRMEPYRSWFPEAGLMLPETEALADRVLVLPSGTAVGPEEVGAVCEIIRLIVEQGRQIQERLRCQVAV